MKRWLTVIFISTMLFAGSVKADAESEPAAAWDHIVEVIAEEGYTAGLREDGSIVFVGEDQYDRGWEQAVQWTNIVKIEIVGSWLFGYKNDRTIVTTADFDLSSWTDVVSVVYSWEHEFVAGLRTDGTVSIAFRDDAEINREYLDVTNWRAIIQLVYGQVYNGDSFSFELVGLRNDGSVVATNNALSYLDSEWQRDIESNPFTGLDSKYFVVGIRADGTVTGMDRNEFYDIESITICYDGYFYAFGIRKDGTVAILHPALLSENSRTQEIKNWHNIEKIVCYADGFPIGIRKDGTVAVTHTSWGDPWECVDADVSSWTGVTDLFCVHNNIDCLIGLKAEGTLYTAGTREYLEELATWQDILTIYITEDHIAGLKRDGTLYAAGDNTYGQCNVTSSN